MNIFLVIPTLKQGGAERVISELANEFSRYSNLTVHLVLLANADDFYQVDECIVVHRLGFKYTSKSGKIKSEAITFLKMLMLLKEYKPIATLSFMVKYNVFTIFAGTLLGLNIFVSDRSSPVKKLPLKMSLLRKLSYRNASGIVAQTTLAKNILYNQTGNNNIQVIPNPVREVTLFPKVLRDKLIINIGRLVPEKGQKYLLEAFAKIEEPEWKLVILGDGPLRESLNQQAVELGIAERLIMPGSVKNVDEWMAKSSIFAFSSISEGFPNALAEAMAAGLPCISFDCKAGPRDIIEHGINGLLVQERNVEQLTIEIIRLIKNLSLAETLGENAQRVRGSYDMKVISTKYLDFLLDK